MQYQEFLNKLHGIQVAEGLGYCMNKPEVYYAVLKEFAKPKLEQLIEKAWDKRNIKDYTIYIHSIKSSARNIGADILSDMAIQLEKAAKNKDISYLEQHHGTCMEEYRNIYQTVKDALAFMEQGKAKEPVKTRKLSSEEFTDYKNRLIDALKDMDPIRSKEILKELSGIDFQQKGIEASIQKMYENVDNYDFDEAELTLKQIQH